MGSLREELRGIYDRHGKLTPELVHEEVKDEAHPLHSRYEWDDAVAGYYYRLSQIGEDIRSLRVEYVPPQGGEPQYVREWTSVRNDPQRDGYAPTEEVVKDPLTFQIVLREMERDIAALKTKWQHMAEFAEQVQKLLAL